MAPRVALVALVVGFGAHRFAQTERPLPMLGNGPLLAPSVRIVDPSIAHGTKLAESLRAGGIGVETYSPQALLGETTPGNWWITKDAAEILEISDVEKLLAGGSNVVLDGVTPISSALLGLQCAAEAYAKNITVPCASSDRTNASDDETRSNSGDANSGGSADAKLDGAPGTDSPNELALQQTDPPQSDQKNFRVLTVATAKVSKVSVNWSEPAKRATPSVAGVVLDQTTTGEPALWRSQAGNVLWSLPSLSGENGPKELPYLLQALEDSFGISPRVEQLGWDLYADPDDYQTQTPAKLVKAWAEAGVHRVYIPAWKQDDRAQTRYEYKKLVDLLHGEGIEAYAWLGWPYVDTSTLIKYPDCQERTAAGTLAQLGGQGFIALAVPECFDRAWTQSAKVLNSAPFDGVNIVNLAFSSAYSGQKGPDVYTPFHPLVRANFISEHGFDPAGLVRPGATNWQRNPKRLAIWENYRANALASIYEKLLSRLQTTWPKRAIAVATMDDRNDPSIGNLLRKNSGQSTDSLLAFQRKYPFELIIGDDLDFRTQIPTDVVKHYVHSGSKPPTMLLSLPERPSTAKPLTTRIGGLELYGQLAELSETGSRVALNPQGALSPLDLTWLKHSLSPNAELRVEGDKIFTSSKRPFRLLLQARASGIRVDGTAVTPGNAVDIPAGDHLVEVQR
jgi:hypothetical protein